MQGFQLIMYHDLTPNNLSCIEAWNYKILTVLFFLQKQTLGNLMQGTMMWKAPENQECMDPQLTQGQLGDHHHLENDHNQPPMT